MLFEDLKWYLNENSIIMIYSNSHELYAFYDGKESIPEYLDDIEVNDIFSDSYVDPNSAIHNAIGIELDFYAEDIILFD